MARPTLPDGVREKAYCLLTHPKSGHEPVRVFLMYTTMVSSDHRASRLEAVVELGDDVLFAVDPGRLAPLPIYKFGAVATFANPSGVRGCWSNDIFAADLDEARELAGRELMARHRHASKVDLRIVALTPA